MYEQILNNVISVVALFCGLGAWLGSVIYDLAHK